MTNKQNKFAAAVEEINDIPKAITSTTLKLKRDMSDKLREINSHDFPLDREFSKKKLKRDMQKKALELAADADKYYHELVSEIKVEARQELLKAPSATLGELEHAEFDAAINSLQTRSKLGADTQKEIDKLIATYGEDKMLMRKLGENYLSIVGTAAVEGTPQEKAEARKRYDRIVELGLTDTQIDAKFVLNRYSDDWSYFKPHDQRAKALDSNFGVSAYQIANASQEINRINEEEKAERVRMYGDY